MDVSSDVSEQELELTNTQERPVVDSCEERELCCSRFLHSGLDPGELSGLIFAVKGLVEVDVCSGFGRVRYKV